MEKTLTAEEYLKKLDEESGTIWTEDNESICNAFIGFAKLHVQKALKQAHKNMQLPEDDLEFTLNSYPLDKII